MSKTRPKETKQERKLRQGKRVRVRVPRERPIEGGTAFQSHDGTVYIRDGISKSIRRARKKTNGKIAKRERREAREALRS